MKTLGLFLFLAIARAATEPDFAPVTAKIQGWIDRGYYPGAALLVSRDGRVVYERSFGTYTPDTIVFLASAGKWLAAATIAAVVDEGKLAWDDPAAKWLPKLKDAKEFVERARSAKHTGIYGLGEWREQLDARGDAVLLSSPSWAGAYPWIDKTCGVWGVFIAHVETSPGGPASKDKFSAFYASPVLPLLVREAIGAMASTPSPKP